LAGFSNNLTQKVNQLQNQNQTQPGDKSIASMIQKGFMTPAINNTSQFSQGAPNEKVTKNRNALLAITGVRETNFQQIVE
jgi:hypothetical protein|tara:strand:- start:381 stop:620 length:240 start_codon:yes stop_codon:yes gene_type:complete